MRDLLIVGCGRSGTSMAGGVLAGAGYFMGERLHPARKSNPRGFFESGEINQINEELLSLVLARLPAEPVEQGRAPYVLERGQRWLSHVPLGAELPPVPAPALDRMRAAVARSPFCFKDPRFCYTLPMWRPLLGNAGFLCVFRHPGIVVESILLECREMDNLRRLAIDPERALRVWLLMYLHVLEVHRHRGDWLFVHYDDFFDPATVARISGFVGAEVDRSFPDRGLRRTTSPAPVPDQALQVYRRLCELAGHRQAGIAG